MLNNLDQLSNMEEHDKWRAAEAQALSDLVQKRLHYLQNPKDCSKARKLICNLNKVKQILENNSLLRFQFLHMITRAVDMGVKFIMLPIVL